MKTDDYNQLKKLCDDNGFELVTQSPFENGKYFVVKKKPEKVKVIFSQSYMNVGEFRIEWFLRNAQKLYNKENSDKISEYLSLKLDEYLNNEL
jgi:hypothetical protein